jgi:hypothetical protein
VSELSSHNITWHACVDDLPACLPACLPALLRYGMSRYLTSREDRTALQGMTHTRYDAFQVRKRHFCPLFHIYNDDFTKTGSGQT